MTGIGCYGKPHHIAETLTRALRRFGVSSADRLDVAWRAGERSTGRGRLELSAPRNVPGGDAVVMISQYGKVAGFFLSVIDGKPRLHVRIRSRGKRCGCIATP